MPEISFPVGVIAERRVIDHPWQDHTWSAVAVLPGAPEMAIGTRLAGDDRNGQFYIGRADIVLATTETTGYRDNLVNPPPRLWVVAHPGVEHPHLVAVTADPMEGEAHTEAADNLVWPVEMPPEIAGMIAEFVDANHVERVFVKRKRKRAEESRGEA